MRCPQLLVVSLGREDVGRHRGRMTTIRLRSREDLLTTLPFQLGYRPSDSAVVVALHARRLGMVARVDLPPDDPAELAAMVDAVVPAVVREDPGGVIVVGYEDDDGRARPALEALADAFDEEDVEVVDRLVVRGDTWWCLDARGRLSAGRPVPRPEDSAPAADFVALEVAPLADRTQLEASVAADPRLAEPVAAELADAGAVAYAGQALGCPSPPPLEQAVQRMRWLAVWAQVLDVRQHPDDPALPPEQVAALVRSLSDIQLRDGVIAWTCPGSLPLDALDDDLVDLLLTCLPVPAWAEPDHGGDPREAAVAGHRVLRRLQWLARSVPDAHCAGVLTVLGQVAWWLGSGALARVAVERALLHHPAYRLALLLERMVDLAIRTPREPPPAAASTLRTRLSAG